MACHCAWREKCLDVIRLEKRGAGGEQVVGSRVERPETLGNASAPSEPIYQRKKRFFGTAAMIVSSSSISARSIGTDSAVKYRQAA